MRLIMRGHNQLTQREDSRSPLLLDLYHILNIIHLLMEVFAIMFAPELLLFIMNLIKLYLQTMESQNPQLTHKQLNQNPSIMLCCGQISRTYQIFWYSLIVLAQQNFLMVFGEMYIGIIIRLQVFVLNSSNKLVAILCGSKCMLMQLPTIWLIMSDTCILLLVN